MKNRRSIVSLLMLLMLGGCATLPAGPSVRVMPGSGKSFEQFQADDAVCRQWAAQQTGQSPQEAVSQNTAEGAVAGTAIGAGLGAAIGAASGKAGVGAAIGAGSGLLVGTSVGASSGQFYSWETQRRYDIAYEQCMYAKGNQVPMTPTRTRHYRRIPLPRPPDLRTVPPDYSPYPGPPPPPPER